MKGKEFTILVVTLVVLLLILLLVANPFKQPGTSPTKGAPLFPALASADGARIAVHGRNDLSLWMEDGEWLVKGETDDQVFPADTAAVFRALRAAQGATDREVVSTNPDKQTIFEVDSMGVTVKIMAADSSLLADFIIGKSGSDYATNYVRRAGASPVYLVGERIKNQFDRPWRGMRDLFIFKAPKEEITRIEITRNDTTVSLMAKGDDAWEMLTPLQGLLKKDFSSRLVNTISNFRADDFAAGGEQGKGFEAPFVKIVVVLKDGTDRTISVGDTTQVEGRRYARMDGRKWIYEIGAYRVDTLTKPPVEILEPPPAEPDTSAAGAPPAIPTMLPQELGKS